MNEGRIEQLESAIRFHRSQIRMRETGRRVSAVAADKQLWKLVETSKPSQPTPS